MILHQCAQRLEDWFKMVVSAALFPIGSKFLHCHGVRLDKHRVSDPGIHETSLRRYSKSLSFRHGYQGFRCALLPKARWPVQEPHVWIYDGNQNEFSTITDFVAEISTHIRCKLEADNRTRGRVGLGCTNIPTSTSTIHCRICGHACTHSLALKHA